MFNGISNLNSKAFPVEEEELYDLTYSEGGDKEFHNFPKGKVYIYIYIYNLQIFSHWNQLEIYQTSWYID